jgi:hypothetical protein
MENSRYVMDNFPEVVFVQSCRFDSMRKPNLFSGANPAIRFNLLWRTPPQKDFHFYRGYGNNFQKNIFV